MGVPLMLALLLLRLCDYTSPIMATANTISPSIELYENNDGHLLSSTQSTSKFQDSLVNNADLVHFLYKSNQLNDLKNAAIMNRSKRNSKGIDRSFIRLGRVPPKPDNSFIRFGRRIEPYIRLGRSSNNKGFNRLGRSDERSDIMRFGRRGDKFIRFGRSDGGGGDGGKSNNFNIDNYASTPETYATRGENNDFLKNLRPVPRIGRNDKFIRFGRRDANIRFGKKSDNNKNLSKIAEQNDINPSSYETLLKSETKEIIADDHIMRPLNVLIDKSDIIDEQTPFHMIKSNDKDYNINDNFYQTNLIDEESELFDDDNIDSII